MRGRIITQWLIKKEITIGIPAFKAKGHIEQCSSSIYIQSIIDKISIIIATDYPEDNYEYLKQLYSTLDISILPCKKNTGSGLARQPSITQIGADEDGIPQYNFDLC